MRLLVVLWLIVIAGGCVVAPPPTTGPPGATRYYQMFTGYWVPLRLRGQISEEAARRKAGTYYIATFDSHGRLATVEKRGVSSMFRHIYEYDADGEPLRYTVETEGGVPRVEELRGGQ